MTSTASLHVRPAVSTDREAVLELMRAIDGAEAGKSWMFGHTWESGWAALLHTASTMVVEAPDFLTRGRRPRHQDIGLLALLLGRRVPSPLAGWRVEAEIYARRDLGPSQLRGLDQAARRLGRKLSARALLVRWYPDLGMDQVVKIQAAHGLSGAA